MTAVRKFRAEEIRDVGPQPAVDTATGDSPSVVSHNLNGQKLGRKGRVTRERILSATLELLADCEDVPISLSAVARKASLGMTSIYNYFADLTELLLAVLEPVIASSEDAFLGMLRERWPDEELDERCYRFIWAYYDFWAHHARLLHLRNAMADARDERMTIHRVQSTQPVIALLAEQMDGDAEQFVSPASSMATVLMTGIERIVTVATDSRLNKLLGTEPGLGESRFLDAEVRLLVLAIRDTRARMASEEPQG